MTPEENRRQKVYTTIFKFITNNHIATLPIDIEAIAKILNAKIVPLSQIVTEGRLTEQEVLNIWKNEDGCVHCYSDKHGQAHYKVAYNDRKPYRRIRFTIVEELSHIILGHTACSDFNVFCQSYSEEKYRKFDEDARIAAGILLCSPKFYYHTAHKHDAKSLATICDITESCAKTRICVFTKFESEITRNPYYAALPVPSYAWDVMSAARLA